MGNNESYCIVDEQTERFWTGLPQRGPILILIVLFTFVVIFLSRSPQDIECNGQQPVVTYNYNSLSPESMFSNDSDDINIKIINDSISKSQNNYSPPLGPTLLPNGSFPFLIFQTGFHKCGTSTMAGFFHNNNIPSVHHTLWYNGKKVNPPVREVMKDNLANGRPLLDTLSDQFMFYADYGTGSERKWYEVILEQYPNSKFILQIRPIHKWLHSRYTHFGKSTGFYMDRARDGKKGVNINGTKVDFEGMEVEMQEIWIIREWEQGWYRYMCDLLKYFTANNVTDQLLIFDIERDNPSRIVSFFKNFNLSLDVSLYGHQGETKETHHEQTMLDQFKKWEAIVEKVPRWGDFSNNMEGEMARIWRKCYTSIR